MLSETDMSSSCGITEAAEKLTKSTMSPLHHFPESRRGHWTNFLMNRTAFGTVQKCVLGTAQMRGTCLLCKYCSPVFILTFTPV